MWTNEGIGGKDALVQLAVLLAATERMVFGTGIANIWARPPQTMHGAAALLAQAYPDRFVLGLGVGYPQQAESVGREYGRPLATLRDYVERMDAPTQLPAPVVPYPRITGANGPRMVALAGEIADGAMPAMVAPEFTAQARQLLGPDKLLVVLIGASSEQGDPATVAAAAGEHRAAAPTTWSWAWDWVASSPPASAGWRNWPRRWSPRRSGGRDGLVPPRVRTAVFGRRCPANVGAPSSPSMLALGRGGQLAHPVAEFRVAGDAEGRPLGARAVAGAAAPRRGRARRGWLPLCTATPRDGHVPVLARSRVLGYSSTDVYDDGYGSTATAESSTSAPGTARLRTTVAATSGGGCVRLRWATATA